MGHARDGEPEFWRIGQTKTKKNESKEDGEETRKRRKERVKLFLFQMCFPSGNRRNARLNCEHG